MNRVWIGLAAIALLALLTISPYTASPILALGYASQRTEPAWVAIPPDTRVFYASEDARPLKAARSGYLDMFSKLPLPAIKAFFKKDLAAKGFAVAEHGMGTISPAVAELIGTAGGLNAVRASDGASMTVSFANEEGLVRKSRLFNIVWRVGAR